MIYALAPNKAAQKTTWTTAYPKASEGNLKTLRGVVFIVNGNGLTTGSYEDIGDHLARQNFLVRLIQRPNGSLSTLEVENTMLETFADFNLPPESPVVLIGHSFGGGSVMEVARSFPSYNIRAVVAIAPNVEDVKGFIPGTVAPSFLALYGSQDEDMVGTSGEPIEAFAAYDRVNGEWTTAIPPHPWIVITPHHTDKAMIYVKGADHSGFVNLEGAKAYNNGNDYISVVDQFCIAKAYITAFLDWQLDGATAYRPMFRGEITPPSVAGMETSKPDYFGNPAGRPIEIFHQFSPRLRHVIEDFNADMPTISVGENLSAKIVYPNSIDSYARHDTLALHLAWPSRNIMRNVTLTVPWNRRNLSAFESIQLRIGQIDSGFRTVANPPQKEPDILVSFTDGNGKSKHLPLLSYGRIPAADNRMDANRGHSQMNTIFIPISDIDYINLSDVRFIRFWVYPGTQGEVMIDNIEAVY